MAELEVEVETGEEEVADVVVDIDALHIQGALDMIALSIAIW